MAYFVADEKLQGYYVSGGVTINIVKYHFECDDAASLPAQGAFISSKKIKISMASTAHTIDTDTLYKMDSSGAWVQQSQPWQPIADYSVISNKPQINGHTLTGNQSGADLGLQNTLTFDSTPTQDSTNPVTSGGIWTDQQRQQSEMNVVANAGAKNYASKNSGSGTNSTAIPKTPITLPVGDYICSFCATSYSGNAAFELWNARNSQQYVKELTVAGSNSFKFAVTGNMSVAKYSLYVNNATISDFMIRPAAITDPTFKPYARTNRELTVLTDEDRAALVEIVDGGAKNMLNLSGITPTVPSGLTLTDNTDGTFNVSGTLTSAKSIVFAIGAISGSLILSGCPSGGGESSYMLRLTKSGTAVSESTDTGSGSQPFSMDGTGYALAIRFAAGTYTGVVFKPMICTSAAWKISQSFQPYRPSWQEMYERIVALETGGNRALTL